MQGNFKSTFFQISGIIPFVSDTQTFEQVFLLLFWIFFAKECRQTDKNVENTSDALT